MDYEHRILLAEKELAHYKEMHTISAIGTTLLRIEANVGKLSAARIVTDAKMQSLIAVLAREHSNGRSNR